MNGGVVDAVGKALPVANYTVPPDASQGADAAARHPRRAQHASHLRAQPAPEAVPARLWTQHTIADGAVAAIRAYEINPVPAAPSVRLADLITAAPSSHLYNAAISPDRVSLTGASGSFGGSYVIGYTASGAASGITPRIVMGSRLNGGALLFALVQRRGPYRDFSCPNPGNTCRWGDYAGATPDPRPTTVGAGEVWLTNQFACSASTSTLQANWRTRIWAARP